MPDQLPFIFARRITNLTDARYFAAKDAAYLTFILEPSAEGFLDPVYMQAMREWVEGPAIIGEYPSPTPADNINEAVAFYKLDGVLLPLSDDLPLIQAENIWIRVPVDTPDLEKILSVNNQYATGWILELPAGSTSWLPLAATIQPLCAQYAVVLQYDGAPDEIEAVMSSIGPAGLGLRGGEEEQVGVKSFDDIEAVFDYLDR